MMGLENKKIEWEKSYQRRENHLFYPNEEYVRFFAKHIAKRNLDGSISHINNTSQNRRAIDFGCGAGRHTLFMEKLGFFVDGFDISENALHTAAELLQRFNSDKFKLKLIDDPDSMILEGEYDIVVACSVLDSMRFSLATSYVNKIVEPLKKNGLFFFDLICNERDIFQEVEVATLHEKGTIQTFYDRNSIETMIGNGLSIIESRLVISKCELTQKSSQRRYLVGQKK